MTDAQAQQMVDAMTAIQQYAQDTDNIHRELLAHAAFQSNVLVAIAVIAVVLSFISAFRRSLS
jgi:ABC-type proline/glycine betaine transport system permease subunit